MGCGEEKYFKVPRCFAFLFDFGEGRGSSIVPGLSYMRLVLLAELPFEVAVRLRRLSPLIEAIFASLSVWLRIIIDGCLLPNNLL